MQAFKFILILTLFVALYALFHVYRQIQFRSCVLCKPNVIHTIAAPTFDDQEIAIIRKTLRMHKKQNTKRIVSSFKITQSEIGTLIPKINNIILSHEFRMRVALSSGFYGHFDPNEKYFIRGYVDESDFMNWHYDENITRGKRVTVVIPLYESICNTSFFLYKDQSTQIIKKVMVKPGQMIVYDGANIYHKITEQKKGCERIAIIIPLFETLQRKYSHLVLNALKRLSKFSIDF